MVRFGKKAALLAMAGVLTAASVTGCSGAIDAEATVVTVGKEKVPLGVVNFYARMMQGQYETYYAGMMGTTAEELWTQDAGDDKTYEESVKDSVMEAVENMYLISQHSGEYEVVLTEDEKEAIQKAAEQFDKDNKDESKEAVSGYRKDIEKYLELMTIQSKMSEKMREGVNEEVSDEEAAQKSMEYVYFSYTSTDESGSVTELTDEEKAKGLEENIVAIDGIATITNKSNKVTNLTKDQLAKIYTGQITNWKDLGGQDEAIVVIGREAGSGTRGAFEELLGIEEQCQYAQELNETGAVLAKVAKTSGSIGYVSLDVLDDTVSPLQLDGVEPSEKTVKDGSYALQRPFVMATNGKISEQSKQVQAVFDFINSDAGQKIIEKVGLVTPNK